MSAGIWPIRPSTISRFRSSAIAVRVSATSPLLTAACARSAASLMSPKRADSGCRRRSPRRWPARPRPCPCTPRPAPAGSPTAGSAGRASPAGSRPRSCRRPGQRRRSRCRRPSRPTPCRTRRGRRGRWRPGGEQGGQQGMVLHVVSFLRSVLSSCCDDHPARRPQATASAIRVPFARDTVLRRITALAGDEVSYPAPQPVAATPARGTPAASRPAAAAARSTPRTAPPPGAGTSAHRSPSWPPPAATRE